MITPPHSRNRILALDPIRGDLEKYVTSTAEGLGESAICLSLFTKDYKKGIDSLLQFAIAVMMDKPIFLLVPHGVEIPRHVEKIADGIERCEYGNVDSMKAATDRLLRKAQEKGFTA